MRNNKGITLIALVITIIVLLILAGVSIAMLTGNNGILNQAQNAASDTEKAEAVERINMELNALYGYVLADSSKITFTKDEIQDVIDNLNGTTCSVTGQTSGSATASATVAITSTVTGVTGGSITIDSAGVATISEASYTKSE